jgi:phosphopantothenate-cysteine ligase
MSSEPSSFSAESYFETQPPPSSLQEDILKVKDFVRKQRDLGRKVVLVTVSDIDIEFVLWIDL